MDINTIRIAITLISFAIFIVIVLWAINPGSRAGFEAASRLPFEEEDHPGGRDA